MLRSRTWFKRFGRLFYADGADEEAMMVQVAKLVVLHEDIMLEIHGALNAAELELGHADETYRRMYFFRRALATAFEMKQAVDVLQGNKAFKECRRSWEPQNADRWDQVVRFFQENNKLIKSWRNNVGAKFTESAAQFSLKQNENETATIELYQPRRGHLEINLKLGMAHYLIAGALSRDRNETEELEDYIRRTLFVVTAAHANAVHVARIIAFELFMKR
jgi:hypothetical protein